MAYLNTFNIGKFRRAWRNYHAAFSELPTGVMWEHPHKVPNEVTTTTIVAKGYPQPDPETYEEKLSLYYDAAGEFTDAAVQLDDGILCTETAHQFFAFDPRCVLGEITVWDGDEVIFDRLVWTTFVCAPVNAIRYVVFNWNSLSDVEKHRTLEILCGWMATETKTLYQQNGEMDPMDLAAQVADVIARCPLVPRFHLFRLEYSPEVDELVSDATESFIQVIAPTYKWYCNSIFKETVRPTENKNRRIRKHEVMGFLHEQLQYLQDRSLSSIQDPVEAFHTREELQRYLALLSEKQLEAMKYDSEGYSNEEVAALMGISLESVKTHLKRGRAKARNIEE